MGDRSDPDAATALLPLIVLPLSGAATIGAASAPYADRIVFLFIGGFILAAGIERWRLHERIALSIASRAGDRPVMLVAGFMIASAAISMWISNTATTLMLMPIAFGAARALAPDKPDLALGGALALGVAHAATIGGIGTPVGTPTNLIGLAFLERAGEPIDFLNWMQRAIPMMLIMLPLAWALLCLPLFGRGRDKTGAIVKVVRDALRGAGQDHRPGNPRRLRLRGDRDAVDVRQPAGEAPGPRRPARNQRRHRGRFVAFPDPIGAGQGEKLIDWPTAERIPWGIAIMFGGGLSLAAAMDSTGLAAWIGAQISGMSGLSIFALIAALVIVDDPGFGSGEQRRHAHLDAADVAAVAAATNTPLQPMAFPSRHRGELRLHAAGRDRAQCDRLLDAPHQATAHAVCRALPQHRGRHHDHRRRGDDALALASACARFR